AEDGIRAFHVTGVQTVLFRSAAEDDVVGEQAVDPHHRAGGDTALDEISEGLHGWFPFDWDDGWVIGKFAAWLLIAAGVFNVAIWPRFFKAIVDDERAWGGAAKWQDPQAFFWVHLVLIA